MTVPAQPDIEAFVWDQISHLPDVTSFCFSALPMPLVPWLVAYQIQVDARARGKRAAWERAEEARRIIWSLPAVPWPDGVISFVQVTEGPFWLPDEDGQPRYCLRAELRAHPNRPERPTGPDARLTMAPG